MNRANTCRRPPNTPAMGLRCSAFTQGAVEPENWSVSSLGGGSQGCQRDLCPGRLWGGQCCRLWWRTPPRLPSLHRLSVDARMLHASPKPATQQVEHCRAWGCNGDVDYRGPLQCSTPLCSLHNRFTAGLCVQLRRLHEGGRLGLCLLFVKLLGTWSCSS